MTLVRATGTVVSSGGGPVLVPTAPELDDLTFALQLSGEDLPADYARVTVQGHLTARSLRVSHWRPDPESPSAWSIPEVPGVAAETVEAIDVGGTPEAWPIISIGSSVTSTGGHVVVLEVDQVSDEIQAWVEQQPAGAVHVVAFIRPEAEVGPLGS